MPTADVSARPAVPGDEEDIAQIQLDAWSGMLGAEAVAGLPRDQILAQWTAAIEAPPTREHRMFVATEAGNVVGFAALAINEVIALEVSPEHRRAGHGSRLLAACVDTMKIFGAVEARAWAIDGDSEREAFLTSAGFGRGGIRRGIDGPQEELHEQLWRAAIDHQA
ncbi:GNAT family N-acetyltransferase [Demequina sediminicola]|uniref:GNAT family N-acetyltransferase n=1 Tax=Demequina sediminicola TaxID=1095026 RepID=UPI0007854858|nr:GNAT family N-acetyltransferase [Demequina sediminicola]